MKMIEDYEEGELERIYLAKYLTIHGDSYLAEPTKKRLAEAIRSEVFGELSEEECKQGGRIELFEINLGKNITRIGEFPKKSLDEFVKGE